MYNVSQQNPEIGLC